MVALILGLTFAQAQETRTLTIGSTSTTASGTVNMGEGNVCDITITVPLTNSGEVDLVAGEEDYTLTLRVGANGTDIATLPIEDNLAVGESVTRDYTFTVDGSKVSGTVSLYLIENVSGNDDYVARLTFNPYVAKFALRESETTSTYSNLSSNLVIDFGTVQEAVSRTYYIYNDGAAPLTLNIDVPEGFSASLNSGVVIGAGEHTPFVITMLADEAGEYDGTLTIKGNDMDDFVINLTGVVLDASHWYESFTTGTQPADMVNGGNWTFAIDATGNGYAGQTSSTVSRLITPKLTVAEGETLTGNIAKYSSYYTSTFKVYKAATRDAATWDLVGDYASEAEYGTWKQFTVSGVEAGDWYFAFEGAYIYLDELYGFAKADVAHDLYVSASTLPTKGEVNSPIAASITVNNMGQNEMADSYQAQLLLGEDVVATAESVDIAQGASAIFNFSYTPHAAVEDATLTAQLIDNEGAVLTKATETITITEEVMSSEVTIGTKSSSTQYYAPLYSYDSYSWSEVVYLASQINVESGKSISKIAFKGRNATAAKGTVQVWIENSTLTAPASSWSTPTEDAAMDAEWSFPVVTDDDLLVVDMSENPFVYTGGSIRMKFKTHLTEGSGHSMYFFSDSRAGSARYQSDFRDATAPSYTRTSRDAPVAWLTVVSKPIVLKGNVTDATTDEPIADVKVTVKNGDVEYYGTSDEDGAYEIEVMKKFDTYTLSVTHSSYFPVNEEITLTEGENTKNIALTEAKDFYIVEQNLPTTGVVNNPYTATVTIQNVNATPFAAGSYTVNLYVGDKVVATAAGEELAANEAFAAPRRADATNDATKQDYTLTYTPHEATTTTARVQVEWGDNSIAGSEVELTITDEVAEGAVRVGTPTTSGTSVPVYLNWEASKSETVYDKSKIALEPNSRITSVAYHGYTTNTHSDVAFKVWLQNTADAAGTTGNFDVDNMTLVYDGVQTIEPAGSSTEMVELLRFNLDAPFEYAGENLRIIVQEVQEDYASATFEADSELYNQSRYRYAGNGDDLATSTTSYTANAPVVYLEYDNARHITGVVTDAQSSDAIAGATVTAVSGEVVYTATTNADGKYDITIVQTALDYNVSAQADGYVEAIEEGVSVSADEAVVDFALEKVSYLISGTVTSVADGAAIAGATITAKTDGREDVVATTDEAGTYEIKVYEAGVEYTLTATATSFKDSDAQTVTVSADTNVDFVLEPLPTAIDDIKMKGHSGETFDLNGRKVVKADAKSGIYIIDGKKVLVK